MKINDYANSMFRQEVITDIWIEKCTSYLINIFGNSIKDKVVLDYAFGRGNWSLAFIQAGAKKVISIDASIDNVKKFTQFTTKKNIHNIEIIHGNIMEKNDLEFSIDLFWIYGILQHINSDVEFLTKLMKFEKKDSIFFIYAYPKTSLRYFLVSNCRKLISYEDEEQYIQDSLYFIKEAQMRVRDDYTAPHIKWYTKKELITTIKKLGLFINSEKEDFYKYLNNSINFEFNPIQIICSRKKSEIKTTKEKKIIELEILQDIFDDISSSLKKEKQKKSFVIGLTNTYYSSIKLKSFRYTIEQLFIYLASSLFTLKSELRNSNTKEYLSLLNSSIHDKKDRKKYYNKLGKNILTDFLIKNKIRL